MAQFPHDALITVRSFVHQVDGEDATIGDMDRQVFLAIPKEGLDILQHLADGMTVGQAIQEFERTHGETPDMDDFLTHLAEEGFVQVVEDCPQAPADADTGHSRRRPWYRSIGFDWLSPEAARRLSGPPTLVVCAVLIVGGLALAFAEPGLIPGSEAMLFPGGDFAALSWVAFVLAILSVSLHELAHGVVARASNVPTRLGIGNVMYTMVAQTDMTAMWMAPKSRRYLAYVAGLIVDGASAAIVLGLLYADDRGWLYLSDTVGEPLARGVLFTYILRITFQFFLYLRTDLYYVFATAFNCRSLMSDTEAYLRNGLARVFRRPRWYTDLSGLPARELRTVRWYAALYLLGRGFSLGVLFVFFLPLLLELFGEFVLLVTGQESRLDGIDFLTAAMIIWIIDGGGLFLWIRSLVRRFRHRRRDPAATDSPSQVVA